MINMTTVYRTAQAFTGCETCGQDDCMCQHDTTVYCATCGDQKDGCDMCNPDGLVDHICDLCGDVVEGDSNVDACIKCRRYHGIDEGQAVTFCRDCRMPMGGDEPGQCSDCVVWKKHQLELAPHGRCNSCTLPLVEEDEEEGTCLICLEFLAGGQ